MEPTHHDPAPERIPRRPSARLTGAGGQAAAFRRTLDEQATTHDATIVMPPVPDASAQQPPQTAHPSGAHLIPTVPVPTGRRPTGPRRPPPSQLGQPVQSGQQGHPGQAPQPRRDDIQGLPDIATTSAPTALAGLSESAPSYSGAAFSGAAFSGASFSGAASPGAKPAAAPTPGAQQPPKPPKKTRTRHSAGNRPARLPAAVGISAVLAVIGGLALILTNGGLAPDPTAPSALPDNITSAVVVAGGTQAGGGDSAGSPTPSASRSATRAPTAPALPPPPAPPTAALPTHPATKPPSAPPTTPPAPPTTAPAGWTTIQRGSTGTEVNEIQSQLTRLGYMQSGDGGFYESCYSYWDSSGSFESATKRAIWEFQENYDYIYDADLPTTGVGDAATWAALNSRPYLDLQYCFEPG